MLSSKTQGNITMHTNTQHKLPSVRAIQKPKLLHYLLVKARSQDKKKWRFEDTGTGTLTSTGD